MNAEKEDERHILLKKIFPSEKLLETGKQLGDSYCLRFDERGYDKEYKRFDEGEVINRLSKLLSDQQTLEFSSKYRDSLSTYWDFRGNYYTYDPKKRELKLESSWPELRREMERLLEKHGENARAFLRACYRICVELDKKWKNYYHIQSKAREFGMKKGWLTMLADFELGGIVTRHKGDIEVPEERVPLLRSLIEQRSS
jgi:hypothetical protein